MSFVGKVSSGFKKHMANLKGAHDRRMTQAEARAREQIANARTAIEKEKALTQLRTERLNAQRELLEARAAGKRAAQALQKAKREAGDVGLGERLMQGISKYTTPKKPVKRVKKLPKKKSGKSDIDKMIWG